LLQGDQKLFNQYSVITLSEVRYPHVNHAGAQALANWLISQAGQAAIADFRIAGALLFVPNALAAQ